MFPDRVVQDKLRNLLSLFINSFILAGLYSFNSVQQLDTYLLDCVVMERYITRWHTVDGDYTFSYSGKIPKFTGAEDMSYEYFQAFGNEIWFGNSITGFKYISKRNSIHEAISAATFMNEQKERMSDPNYDPWRQEDGN